MVRNITVLIVPIDAYGHVYACIGLAEAEPLRDRGHNVVFATPNGWKGKLKALGFQEECYSTDGDENVCSSAIQSGEYIELILKLADAIPKSLFHQIKEFFRPAFQLGTSIARNSETSLKKIIAKVKPDVIIVDTVYCQPCVVNSGIPWILSASISPVAISKENSPPGFFGLSFHGDRNEWTKFEEAMSKECDGIFKAFNSWAVDNGADPIAKNYPFFMNPSPYANIYMYPKELDYSEFRSNPPKWHQFDTFIRSTSVKFDTPEVLTSLPGRLIYFSMGSLGSSDVQLMKRLVEILAKSPHRFIVSKGALGDKYELPSNMWGSNMVPETAVIPLVDLVITHGGNNTVTESFHFGKPCIVLPLFGDQHDNAQRIYELGLGLKFKPYEVTETELLTGIEKTLANIELTKRMQLISKRIQSSSSKARAADLIENVALRRM